MCLVRDELLRNWPDSSWKQVTMGMGQTRILVGKSRAQGFDPKHDSLGMTDYASLSRGCFELSSLLPEMLGRDIGSKTPMRKGNWQNGQPDPRFKFWSRCEPGWNETWRVWSPVKSNRTTGQKLGKKACKTKTVGPSWGNPVLQMIVDARLQCQRDVSMLDPASHSNQQWQGIWGFP